jgi:hypothetical protein
MESNLTTAEAMVRVAEINAQLYSDIVAGVVAVALIAIVAWGLD